MDYKKALDTLKGLDFEEKDQVVEAITSKVHFINEDAKSNRLSKESLEVAVNSFVSHLGIEDYEVSKTSDYLAKLKSEQEAKANGASQTEAALMSKVNDLEARWKKAEEEKVAATKASQLQSAKSSILEHLAASKALPDVAKDYADVFAQKATFETGEALIEGKPIGDFVSDWLKDRSHFIQSNTNPGGGGNPSKSSSSQNFEGKSLREVPLEARYEAYLSRNKE